MNDKTELLRSLRIDRKDRVDRADNPGRVDRVRGVKLRRSTPAKLVGGLLALTAAAVMGWFFLHPAIPRVRTAAAELAPGAAESANPQSLLDASGYVVARRQATVSSKITGRLQQLFIEEGQRVAQSDVLARLDDTNTLASVNQAEAVVRQAQAELRQAETAVADALPIYLRDKQLAAAGVISTQALEDSKAKYDADRASLSVAQSNLDVRIAEKEMAQRNEDDTVVRAPFAGVITSKNAQPGEIVSPLSAAGAYTRSGIGTLVDMDSLEVEVDVSESFISRVKRNDEVVLKLNAYPDWRIPAYVEAIVPTADRNKATFKVRVGFHSHDPRILPEMGARVSFLAATGSKDDDGSLVGRGGVLVPPEAVQAEASGDGKRGVVFVLHDDTLERRVVKLGPRIPAGQMVESGVSRDERVAIGDLSHLADGCRVDVVNR